MGRKRCPKCGSLDIRKSNGTEFAGFTGKVVAKLAVGAITLPFGSFVNKAVGMGAGNAGKEIGEAFWNKLVCKKCKHVWWNEGE